MKKIYFTLVCIVIAMHCNAQCTPPAAPAISPASSFVSFGQSVTLRASGCSGTVKWSTGQTGTSITITPKDAISIVATCTVAGCTSLNSIIAGIGINWTNVNCDENIAISTPLSNTYAKYEASGQITGTSIVSNTASAYFNGKKAVNLNPGFNAQSGSLFKASIEGCVSLQTRTVAQSLAFPWELIWGPDNFIWFTERPGRIGRINPTTGVRTLNFTIPDCATVGEGGALGMVLHPDFSNNKYLYVVYNYYKTPPNTNYTEKVVRYTYDAINNTLIGDSTLLDNIPANTIHNGSRLYISDDLKLFIGTGDAGDGNLAQNDNSLAGKILRINLDGSIPADNPSPTSKIWTKGHRNPQGIVVANGKMYETEHGPNNDDEVNIIEKGRNYGWPNVEGYCFNNPSEQTFCNTNNVKEPISAWTPTIAVSGAVFYDSNLIPQWKNSLLVSILKDQMIMQLKLNPSGDYVIERRMYYVSQFGRLRDFCISPAGKVYVATSNGSDSIIEISPAN